MHPWPSWSLSVPPLWAMSEPHPVLHPYASEKQGKEVLALDWSGGEDSSQLRSFWREPFSQSTNIYWALTVGQALCLVWEHSSEQDKKDSVFLGLTF